MLLLVLFLALLSPWFMVLSALLYAQQLEARAFSRKRHPSAARVPCGVCGALPYRPEKENDGIRRVYPVDDPP